MKKFFNYHELLDDILIYRQDNTDDETEKRLYKIYEYFLTDNDIEYCIYQMFTATEGLQVFFKDSPETLEVINEVDDFISTFYDFVIYEKDELITDLYGSEKFEI